ADVTRWRQSEYDSELDGERGEALHRERESLAAEARADRDGSEAEAFTLAATLASTAEGRSWR
ncbi:hypothetical protein AB0J43_00005, partial [Nonomuraea fuscirosea]